ncbi:MAG TPA: NnrU family protein [Smithellaceae bacterium]|nr:NnrU family protein [Smithellaceae bacterium]HQM44637.1 NnrU family protein [Smithellaceae bacterium]
MEISVNDFYAVIGWVLWCALHSVLISITVMEYMKIRLGDWFRFYRFFYNAVSVATLIPLVYYSHTIRQTPVFRWEGPLMIVQIILLAASIYLFVVGGRHYSWAQFSGIAQIRAGRAGRSLSRDNAFVVSGIHRMIRHPWYLGGILVVWSQDLGVSTILINMVISIYFMIGAVLEERKLVLEFGDVYREYQRTVPMLSPWRLLKAGITGS